MSTETALISKILLKKLREETLTAQEAETLAEWEGRSPAHAAFINNMIDETYLEDRIKNLLAQDQETGWEKIERKIDRQQGEYGSKRSTGWDKYAVAASLILLAGIAVYYFAFRPQVVDPGKTHIPATLAQVLPGTKKAQLVLANNSIFELDTIQNKKFAEQPGADILKKDSGTISYEIRNAEQEAVAPINKLITPRGGEYRLILPDGTVVYLNAASSIQFPAFFSRTERRVEITGEAFFEVAPSKDNPFKVVIKTAAGEERAEVLALGTQFNIKAYDDQNTVTTTLVEGKVRIAPYRSTDSAILAPGQQANLANGQVLDISPANIEQALAWKTGMFSFKSTSIQAAMAEISRWYNIDVVFEGPVAAEGINGDIERTISLEELLAVVIPKTMTYNLENGKLVVRPRKTL